MDSPEDFRKLGINPDKVETWEDGPARPVKGSLSKCGAFLCRSIFVAMNFFGNFAFGTGLLSGFLSLSFFGIVNLLSVNHLSFSVMKRLFFDMDNVLVDFSSGIAKLDEKTKSQYEDHLDDVPGIFSLMEPLPGAIEAVHLLKEKFDVYILSTAPWDNPSAWADKVSWVTKYLDDVFHKRLILSHQKDFLIGDFLIDDRDKHGAEDFRGEWIHFGSERFPTWKSVTDYLLPKA
jgi:5'(3')-deoxyribonucleotidase